MNKSWEIDFEPRRRAGFSNVIPLLEFVYHFKKMTAEKFNLSQIWQPVQPVLMKCWALSGAAVFTFLLVYWIYGGVFALFLLGFAFTGNQ